MQDDSATKACDGDHEQELKLDVTNIQSYQALTQQLRITLHHVRDLCSCDTLKEHAACEKGEKQGSSSFGRCSCLA